MCIKSLSMTDQWRKAHSLRITQRSMIFTLVAKGRLSVNTFWHQVLRELASFRRTGHRLQAVVLRKIQNPNT